MTSQRYASMHFLTSPIIAAGRYAILWANHFLRLLGLLGRVVTCLPNALIGEGRIRRRDIVNEIDVMGVHSLALIFMASVTTAISSVVLSFEQLTVFGGLSLVSFFSNKIILREVAPLIVGIVLTVKAGPHVITRIGRAAPRQGNETRDNRHGLEVNRLLIPSVVGISIVGPALYLISVALSLWAGVISQSFGSTENFRIFFNSFLDHMMPGDLAFGLAKSFAFGFAVVLICGHLGFETASDPESLRECMLTGIVATYIAILILNVLFVYGYEASQLLPGL